MPFRDDLEAARARSDALAEENEALRGELVALRARAEVAPPAPARPPGLDALTEATLARLDAEADASAPASVPVPAPPPPPKPRLRGEAPITLAKAAPLVVPDPQPEPDDPSRLEAWSHRHRAEELARELAEVRAAARLRTIRWSALLFAIGALLGALLAR